MGPTLDDESSLKSSAWLVSSLDGSVEDVSILVSVSSVWVGFAASGVVGGG